MRKLLQTVLSRQRLGKYSMSRPIKCSLKTAIFSKHRRASQPRPSEAPSRGRRLPDLGTRRPL